MGQITPLTSMPARNSTPAGAVTALGSTLRFYGVLTTGAVTLSLIQKFASGDWDYVRSPNGIVTAQVQAPGNAVESTDVVNPNSGTVYALIASTPVPAGLRAYIDDLVDPAAGSYTGPALSSTLPAEIGATASFGAGSTAARTDHVHTMGADALLVAVPIGTTTPAAGAFTTLSASSALSLSANVNIGASTGTGGLNFGAMTGATALPTGNLSWAGASTKTLSLAASGAAAVTSSGGALTLTGGAASTWSTSSGALTITSAAAATWSTAAGALGVDAAAALNLGGSTTTAVNVGRSGVLATFASKTAFGATTQSVTDPGASGAIPVTANGVCNITTAAAETRTLAIPSFVGQQLVIAMDTDGGDCVITVASPFNQTGNNTITLNDAGDVVTLVGRTQGGTRKWALAFNDGATLSTV